MKSTGRPGELNPGSSDRPSLVGVHCVSATEAGISASYMVFS